MWRAVKALQEDGKRKERRYEIVVYTGDVGVTKETILGRVRERFNIEIDSSPTANVSLSFVYLRTRSLVEARLYPRFTMLGQSLGSVILALEALFSCRPDVFVDTTGYAFSFPCARFMFGCKVVAYVHYPTITVEMMNRVFEQRPSHNNSDLVAGSSAVSSVKMLYYRVFAFMYGLVGKCADVVMTNSSWTHNHILSIWGLQTSETCTVVFPPCDTTEFHSLPLHPRKPIVLSVGQFRPEKDHSKQLAAFAKLLERVRDTTTGRVEEMPVLVLLGACRDEGDTLLVKRLQEECRTMGITDHVKFELNVPFSTLKRYLGEARVGIHTMWNEHFGIGIVEMMAAGVFTVAHDSGGPKLDIVVNDDEGRKTGFRASTAEQYCDKLEEALKSSDANTVTVEAARRHVAKKFSNEVFEERFLAATNSLLP